MTINKTNFQGWFITKEKASEINNYLPDHVDVVILDDYEGVDSYFIEDWVYERFTTNPEQFGINPASGLDQVFDPNIDSILTLRNDFRLWKYVPEELHDKPITTINYSTEVNGRLQSIITDHHKGEVTEITLYAEVFRNNFGLLYGIEPIIKEEYTYFRDPNSGLITHRTQQIDYFYEDGSMQQPKEKLRTKYYTTEEALRVGERRRKNTLDFIKVPVGGMISFTEKVDTLTSFVLGSSFLESLEDEISSFIKTPRLGLLPLKILDLTTDDFFWLDNIIIPSGTTNTFGSAPADLNVTIRGYILDQIDIDN